MSFNVPENVFWSLAKEYNIIQAQSAGSPSKLNVAERKFKVMKHATENSLIIMEDICALKKKIRKLEHEKNIQYLSARNRFFLKMCADSISVVKRMNTDLAIILCKKHVILHLLQNAPKEESIHIPVHLHRTFINLVKGLQELCNFKVSIIDCFCKLSDVKWDENLQEMEPLKQQTLRNISILKKLLFDVCQLQISVDKMLHFAASFVRTFLDEVEMHSES
ncbi:uncharacterized protein LOC110836049 [Zootermopsis nevadensis]|uniref:Uncharacterized protein n=1 Tax=Zootermopsis nevadensis TaxID=136037 RepID=A0A067R1B4_ZOONE|nr:uncharacterized protein LOC110836049 [Zootermopsis nevadensis]XP_021932568.1 uncharacterized protein LOC110836049 [Zootermopsis nevadensis]KDR12663.1 hypothetical protein L798_13322 [Zootermopsis nevadensis]